MGWVQRRRDHGGLIFVDLRDREGITQVVFDPQISEEAHERAGGLRSEYVIAAKGKTRFRPEGMANPKLPTGEIEVAATELRILNSSKTPPFQVEDDVEASENIRLKYRYLDLRRPKLFHNLLLRHKVAQLTRGYFNELGFIEVETPVLTRSTPGRGPRLPGAEPGQHRKIFRPAPIAPAFQADSHDCRFRKVLSDRQVLP